LAVVADWIRNPCTRMHGSPRIGVRGKLVGDRDESAQSGLVAFAFDGPQPGMTARHYHVKP